MAGLSFLYPYLQRQWRMLLFGALVAALGAGVGALGPLILRQAVNTFQANGIVTTMLLRFSLLLVGAGVADGVFKFLQRMLFGVSSYHVEFELRRDLFVQLMRLDQEFYGRSHTGDLMARATNDISAVRQFLGPGVSSVVGAVCTLAASAVLMLAVNAWLALVVLLLLPATSVIFVLLGWRIQYAFRSVQEQFGDLSTKAQENFSGIRTIKAYSQEQAEIRVFAQANEVYRNLNLRYVLLSGLLWPLMLLVLGMVNALVLLLGGQMVAAETMTLGDLVLFISYMGLLSWPMIALGWTVNLAQQAAASVGRIAEILRHTPRINSDSFVSTDSSATITGDVELREVSLTLDEQLVLDRVSLRVPEGTSLALVGATGAGKSILAGLLGRIRDPDAGHVLIGGRDIRTIPLEVLRRSIGYVPQDTFLFSVPLRENLLFGDGNGASDDKVTEALEVSQLVNDMPQFPDGLDTMVGERGVTLSGGQKQRATIARAVLRDPTVLVLDDALSSVDTYTAARILAGLRRFMAGRTSILISQRIATVKEADQIVVLERGQIVEQGTHQALLAVGGRYANMYRRELLQSELEAE